MRTFQFRLWTTQISSRQWMNERLASLRPRWNLSNSLPKLDGPDELNTHVASPKEQQPPPVGSIVNNNQSKSQLPHLIESKTSSSDPIFFLGKLKQAKILSLYRSLFIFCQNHHSSWRTRVHQRLIGNPYIYIDTRIYIWSSKNHRVDKKLKKNGKLSSRATAGGGSCDLFRSRCQPNGRNRSILPIWYIVFIFRIKRDVLWENDLYRKRKNK